MTPEHAMMGPDADVLMATGRKAAFISGDVPFVQLHHQNQQQLEKQQSVHPSVLLLHSGHRYAATAQLMFRTVCSSATTNTITNTTDHVSTPTLKHAQIHAATAIRCYEALLSPAMLAGGQHYRPALATHHPIASNSFSGSLSTPDCAAVTTASTIPLTGVSPSTEAYARLGLAQLLWLFTDSDQAVESHLSKALLLAQKLDRSYDLYFKASDLQLSISDSRHRQKQSRQIYKQVTERAIELRQYSWYFFFVSRRLAFLELQKEWGAYLSISSKAIVHARAVQDHDTAARLISAQIRIKLITGSVLSVQRSISQFEESLCVLVPPEQQNLDRLVPGKASEFILFKQMALILLNLRLGNHKNAVTLLPAMHSVVEHMDATTLKQMQLLAYLLSGVVHKPDDSFKAKAFLTGGLSLANYEYDIRVATGIAHIKTMIISHLVQVCLVRSEYSEACHLLKEGTLLCGVNKGLMEVYELHMKFNWALLLQALEMNVPANRLYGQVQHQLRIQSEKSPISHDVLLADLGWLALFHRYIMSFRNYPKLVVEVEIPESESFKTQAFASLLQGFLKASIGNTQQAKQHILESFKLAATTMSLQQRIVCLAILSSLFLLSEPEQSEKMAVTALKLSKRAHSEPLLACCMGLLAQVASRRGEAEKACKLLEGADQRSRANQSAIISARVGLPASLAVYTTD
ncbi:hypothetical protein BASA61_004542 [Batrachochytrium salamandrivorans]|nr:hypothetical protein BASA61_004542 [Batrachochytrium salamandrivorans]KAH9270380.1 hypothetical protein BASA83_007543 [Batrachochytrium salamandrivorans]